jgi:hypothetical protein
MSEYLSKMSFAIWHRQHHEPEFHSLLIQMYYIKNTQSVRVIGILKAIYVYLFFPFTSMFVPTNVCYSVESTDRRSKCMYSRVLHFSFYIYLMAWCWYTPFEICYHFNVPHQLNPTWCRRRKINIYIALSKYVMVCYNSSFYWPNAYSHEIFFLYYIKYIAVYFGNSFK